LGIYNYGSGERIVVLRKPDNKTLSMTDRPLSPQVAYEEVQ
jgi:hypothetical protein